MTDRLRGISVVLPALNEQGNVRPAVEAARAAAARLADRVEVIVVDDGSRDGTAEEARQAGARVVSHETNRGYGAALRSGFAAAAEPWIFQMDCDNQFDPEELAKLVALSREASIVIGVRNERADEPRRIWAGRAWNGLVRLVFGRMARDIDCGFKLLDRAAVGQLDLRTNGACISVELCVAGRKAGLRIAEIGVGHRPRTRGLPTGLRPRVVARGLLELYRLRRRYGGRPGGLASRMRTPAGLLSLFALGLAIRLIVVRYSAGLAFDMSLFREWSDRLVDVGPSHFYAPGYFADYPPGYLYVLWGLGQAWRALLGAPPSVAALKLPAVLADLGAALMVGLLAGRVVRRGTGERPVLSAGAAAAVLLNPALILVSAVWGQVDSVLALLVLAGIYALATERPGLTRQACGMALLAIALATKPQTVLALPLVAVVLARPLVVGAGSSWRALWDVGARALVLAGLMTVVVMLLFVPFGVAPGGVPAFFGGSGSVYPFTSLWAFNLWGAVGFYRPDSGPGAVSLAGVAAFRLAFGALVLAALLLAARGWRALARGVPPAAVATFGAVAMTCAGFALLTRMHERYLYLAVAGLAPFVGCRQLRWALVALSGCFLLNVHFVYVYFAQHSLPPGSPWTVQPLYDALFGAARDAWQLKAWSLATAAACLGTAALGWRWLEAQVDTSRQQQEVGR